MAVILRSAATKNLAGSTLRRGRDPSTPLRSAQDDRGRRRTDKRAAEEPVAPPLQGRSAFPRRGDPCGRPRTKVRVRQTGGDKPRPYGVDRRLFVGATFGCPQTRTRDEQTDDQWSPLRRSPPFPRRGDLWSPADKTGCRGRQPLRRERTFPVGAAISRPSLYPFRHGCAALAATPPPEGEARRAAFGRPRTRAVVGKGALRQNSLRHGACGRRAATHPRPSKREAPSPPAAYAHKPTPRAFARGGHIILGNRIN